MPSFFGSFILQNRPTSLECLSRKKKLEFCQHEALHQIVLYMQVQDHFDIFVDNFFPRDPKQKISNVIPRLHLTIEQGE